MIFDMTTLEEVQDYFRPEFKRYKSRATPLNLQDVVDVDSDRFDGTGQFQVWKVPHESATAEWETLASSIGLQPPRSWRCYAAAGFPGLRFIRDPFIQGWQRYWVKRCITDYPCKPNVTNLDAYLGVIHSPWQASQQILRSGSPKEKTAMDKLRWVTLGYHYDWDNKIYHQHRHSPFPEDLSLVSEVIAAALGYGCFQSQAAIVNLYHMDSTLGGHTDHSEFDLSAPVLSYSLGQSAILLVGGETKATKPVAIHLRSGDIVILGGASRLAYHAVPRIMHAAPGGQLPECFSLPDSHQHKASQIDSTVSQIDNTVSQVDNTASQVHNTVSQVTSIGSQVSRIASQENCKASQVSNTASQVNSIASQVDNTTSQLGNTASQVCSMAGQVSSMASQKSSTADIPEINCKESPINKEEMHVEDEGSEMDSNKISSATKISLHLGMDRTKCSNDMHLRHSVSKLETTSYQQRNPGMKEVPEATSKLNMEATYSSGAHPTQSVSESNSDSGYGASPQSPPLPLGWRVDRVRRVIECMNHTMSELSGQEAWAPFKDYLKNARVNISVRQVTGPGKGFPEMSSDGGGCEDQEDESIERKKTKIEDR